MSSTWASAKISWLPRCAAAHLIPGRLNRGKADPIGPHRRHQREEYGGLAQSGPSVADRQQGIGVHAAAPPSIALACSTRGTCHTRTLLSWTPQKKNIASST